MEMPCLAFYEKELPEALENGTITEEDLDEAVGFILRTVYYYETRKDPQEYGPEVIACEEHLRTARRAAEESMVLLKNEGNILPLDKKATKKDPGAGRAGRHAEYRRSRLQ